MVMNDEQGTSGNTKKFISETNNGVKSVVNKIIKKPKPKHVHRLMSDYKHGEELSEDELRAIAKQKFFYKRSFWLHLSLFFIGNLILLIINMLFTPSIPWFLDSLLGWALIGSIMHLGSYWMFKAGVRSGMSRAVIYNILSYLSVMIFLVYTNLTQTPSYLWVIFPGVFWGFGVLVLIVINAMLPKNGANTKKAAVEKEMEKLRARYKTTDKPTMEAIH